MAVAVDSAHGLIGNIRAGDHIDILSGINVAVAGGQGRAVMRILMQDVLVLGIPEKQKGSAVGAGANETSDVTLRLPSNATSKVAFAADNGRLWLALRPQNGANLERSTLVTLASLLVADKPVKLAAAGIRP